MSELSYLEKLMDGVEVEWKPLGNIAKIQRGASPRPIAQFITDDVDGVPWIKIGDTKPGSKYVKETEQKISKEGAKKSRILKKGDFIISNSMSFGRPYILGIEGAIHDGWASISEFEKTLKSDFLYYYLSSQNVQNYWLSKINSGSVSNLNSDIIKTLLVPIPCPNNPEKSFAIQSEIVRILDAFTALTAELTTELTARNKQYNHYRDQLLNFDESEVEWKTLLDACDYVDYRGKTPSKTQKGIFLVTAKNIRKGFIDYGASQEFIAESDYPIVMRRGFPKIGDILITTEAPCGFVAQVDREDIALAQRVIKYRSNDKRLSNSFLKHYLLGNQFQEKLMRAATGSTVKGIKGSKLHQLKVPIPSEAEQARIVTILDNFDTLTNSISEGLPREIELRQKQYEYYRDLLFSFPETNFVNQ